MFGATVGAEPSRVLTGETGQDAEYVQSRGFPHIAGYKRD